MFVSQPLENEGNREFPLSVILDRFDKEQLKLPGFQRDFIWQEPKIFGWATSIRSRSAIGVIVTYQIVDSGGSVEGFDFPIFLNDGRQRIGASFAILENPEAYGFASYEEAIAIMGAFSITVQHRQYKDHDEALKQFQALNQGTAATPADFYKGELTNQQNGMYIYKQVLVTLEELSMQIQRPWRATPGYETESKFNRDSLAQFYQYALPFKGTEFWSVAKRDVNTAQGKSSRSIEALVAAHIAGKSKSEIDDMVVKFKSFASQQVAMMRQILTSTRTEGIGVSGSMFRHLLHFTTWRKNNGLGVDFQEKYLRVVFEKTPKLNTVMYLPDDENGPRNVVLSLQNLRSVGKICDSYGIKNPMTRKRRKRNNITLPGWELSHTEPYITHGDGDTFVESAPLNRARGASEAELTD